jgi:hypothetical protein
VRPPAAPTTEPARRIRDRCLTVCRCWELRLRCAVVTPEGTGRTTDAQGPRLLAGFKSGARNKLYRQLCWAAA